MSSKTIHQAHGAPGVVQQELNEAAWLLWGTCVLRSLQGPGKVQRYQERSHVNWKELHVALEPQDKGTDSAYSIQTTCTMDKFGRAWRWAELTWK